LGGPNSKETGKCLLLSNVKGLIKKRELDDEERQK